MLCVLEVLFGFDDVAGLYSFPGKGQVFLVKLARVASTVGFGVIPVVIVSVVISGRILTLVVAAAVVGPILRRFGISSHYV